MSAYPRRVLSSGYVTWDQGAARQVNTTFVRAGTLIDAAPGSPLEAAYSGLGLSGVLTVAGDPTIADKNALGN